jgi:hypothetical protein
MRSRSTVGSSVAMRRFSDVTSCPGQSTEPRTGPWSRTHVLARCGDCGSRPGSSAQAHGSTSETNKVKRVQDTLQHKWQKQDE